MGLKMHRRTTSEKLKLKKEKLEYEVKKLSEAINYFKNEIESLKMKGKFFTGRYVTKGLDSAELKRDRVMYHICELDREIQSLSVLDKRNN